MIRKISHSSSNWDAAYLDLLRIRLVCTFAYLDEVMTAWYGSEYELKAYSILVDMHCFESNGRCNISRFDWQTTRLLTAPEFIILWCCTCWRNVEPFKCPSIFVSSLNCFLKIFYLWANLSDCHIAVDQNIASLFVSLVWQTRCRRATSYASYMLACKPASSCVHTGRTKDCYRWQQQDSDLNCRI